jgi:hypothetical protein
MLLVVVKHVGVMPVMVEGWEPEPQAAIQKIIPKTIRSASLFI